MSEENKWDVNFTTHTRDEALLMADFLARAIEPRLCHDPDNVPLIIVTGGFNHGKSMICEAMTRSFLDQESIQEMIEEGQRFHHYLETAPSTALHTYCYQMGTIDGQPAAVSFDRITEHDLRGGGWRADAPSKKGFASLEDEDLLIDMDEGFEKISSEQMYQNTFIAHTSYYTGLKRGYGLTEGGHVIKTAQRVGPVKDLSKAFRTHKKVGGAIFSSGHHLLPVVPWIHFTVKQPNYGDYPSRFAAGALPKNKKEGGKKTQAPPVYNEDDPKHPKWHKAWDLKINSEELKASPRFNAFWEKLVEYTQTGVLNEPDLSEIDSEPRHE